MFASAEASGAQYFAAGVLRNLLRYIDDKNTEGHPPVCVSHAWTDGPMMYLVCRAPTDDVAWGLARDTRSCTIEPGPWLSVEEALLYYYLTDLEEGRMPASFADSGETDGIAWCGFPLPETLPERLSDIAEAWRRTPPTDA